MMNYFLKTINSQEQNMKNFFKKVVQQLLNLKTNIVEQEKRRQFLSSLSGGIVIPEILVKKEYRKENQTKTIKYIDLDKYHSKKKPSDKSMKELYERNKNIFFTEFKKIRYAEITPEKISGNKEYDESFFKQLDIIENNILDGQSFDDTVQNDNLKLFQLKKLMQKKKMKIKIKLKNYQIIYLKKFII